MDGHILHQVEYLISKAQAISYGLTGSETVKCLDSQQVEEVIEKNLSAQFSGTCQAKRSNSDLIPNVYEGRTYFTEGYKATLVVFTLSVSLC